MHPGDVILLDPSTTCSYMVPYLPQHTDLLAITSGLKTALALSERHIRTMVTGGAVMDNSYSMVGSHTEPLLRNAAQTHREQSADLSLAAARAIAGAALDRFPHAPLRAALEVLAQEIDASPRLVVRASGLDDERRAAIEQACAESGFTGAVAFRDEPGMALAAFQLEWADGRADHDPQASAERVAEALSAALAAEAGHAETLSADRSDV